MDLRLQHARQVWQNQLESLEASNAAESALSELRDKLVSVVVDFAGDIGALREAGMDTGFDSGGRVAGHIAFKDLDRLDAVPGVESIALVPQPKPALDGTVPEARIPWKVSPQTFSGKGAGVIVAVVDTGIDVFHESFRNNDATKSTRILELWDQSATAGGSAPPAAFQQLGRVYSANDINASLPDGGPVFPSVDTNGHGTHVAGIAAGNGQQDDRCSFPGHYVGVAPEADLVIVKAIDIDNANLHDALAWCAAAGTRLQQPGKPARPVVINCSFGHSTGPHDGTDSLDGAVNDVLRPGGGPAPAGLAVVAAAGNDGTNQIREMGTVPANGNVTVKFSMPDGSLKDDYLEIWYTGGASLTVEVVAPPSNFPPPVTTGQVAPGGGQTTQIGKMSVGVTSSASPQGNGKRMIGVTIWITNQAERGKVEMRPGIWEIHLTNTAGVDANWEAWFLSSNTDGYPTFALPGEPGIVPRRRDNTTDSPGTSLNAITVANYSDGDGLLVGSSSRAAADQSSVIDVGQRKPTLAAPGATVAAPRSQNDPDKNFFLCDQKVVDKTGTSMASPHVAGVVALMLQRNGSLTFDQLRGHLQQAARIDGIPNPEIPPVVDNQTGIRNNALWGAGKLDAAATIAAMPPAPGGGGGVGGKFAPAFDVTPQYIPHTPWSRIGHLQNRFGPRPGLMLLIALCSEHIDEVMRLINSDRRVTLAWRRGGGHLLVRHLLHGPSPANMVLPKSIPGCDVPTLMGDFGAVLYRAGGSRLRADLERFAEFLATCPGADLQHMDTAALAIGASR